MVYFGSNFGVVVEELEKEVLMFVDQHFDFKHVGLLLCECAILVVGAADPFQLVQLLVVSIPFVRVFEHH